MKESKKSPSKGKNAALLAAVGIIAKLIGALYRVPLTNIVGAEGMGLYQMVFPLYTVLLAFCGGGMTSAVSRVVAKYSALGRDGEAVRVLKVAFLPLLGISAVCTVGVALLRNVISGMQGNTDAALAYLALCPSLLFASGISVLRGYFQGRMNVLPSGISQLIEQISKLALGLYLSKVLLSRGVKYAVAGALIGVTAGEFVALGYLFVRYLIVRGKRKIKLYARPVLADAETSAEFSADVVTDGALLKELYSFGMSVTLGSLVLPITQIIDSVLVINLLMYGGATRGDATALFGLFVGPVGTLINMPTVVALSVSIAYLPAITAAVEKKESATEVVKSGTKWIMLAVIPIAIVFAVFPDRVCAVLYRRGLTDYQLSVAANLLRIESVSVFYIGVLQISTAVLQGNNKAHRPVINLVIGAAVKVGLTPLAVRAFGIAGAAGATVACYAVAATLSARSASKCMYLGAGAVDTFVKPIASTVAGIAAFMAVIALLDLTGLPYLWKNIIGAAVFAAVYIVGIIASKAVDLKPIFARVKTGAKRS